MNKKNLNTEDPKAITKMMLKTLLSTTWRIFAPVTVLFLIGLAIDLNTAAKPWGAIIGTSLGIIIAIVLVVAQLKDIRRHPAVVRAEGDK